MLAHIVDAVNLERRTPAHEEPFSLIVLLQRMNVIPETAADDPEVFDRAYRLLKLQLKQQDAEDGYARMGRRSGAARVVRAAIDSSRWGVAVWPVYEGPDDDHRLHVADRLDIRRADGTEIDPEAIDQAVWSDPDMKTALRQTTAMPSNWSPRWSDIPEVDDDEPVEADDVSRWAISHVTAPREPVVSTRWPNLRAVALVATTRKSLVNEVASLVAVGLGYGVISTPYLAMTAVGSRPSETRLVDQYKQHLHLLEKPPHRRVWSHWGMPPGQGDLPFGTYNNVEDTTPRFVLLDESDELLGRTVDGRLTFDELDRARDELRVAARAFPDDYLLSLPTDYVANSHDRWLQVFAQAARVLEWLSEPGMVQFAPRLVREAHEFSAREDLDVAAPFLRWLRATHNWPTSASAPEA